MSRKNRNENYKGRRWGRNIALVLVAVLLSTTVMTGLAFASDSIGNTDVSTWFEKEINPSNLINIKAEGYTLEEKIDKGTGVKLERDEYGAIKLSGKASEADSFTVGVFVLEPGTYTLSGVKSNSDCGLKVVGPNIEKKSGTTENKFTIEETTSVTVSIYVAEDASFFLGKTILPTLVRGDVEGDFYA